MFFEGEPKLINFRIELLKGKVLLLRNMWFVLEFYDLLWCSGELNYLGSLRPGVLIPADAVFVFQRKYQRRIGLLIFPSNQSHD